MPEELLHGWGRTATTRSEVRRPRSEDELADALAQAGRSGRAVLPRGQGLSYGDAAQVAGGLVLQTDGLDRVGEIVPLGPDLAQVGVGAGVTLSTLARTLLPAGWWLPVVPGTSKVSVGGAVASDVHGKSHHLDGTIARHVAELKLVDGTGEGHVLLPGDPRFDATTGGMGLTGVVTGATLLLRPVRTAWMRATTTTAPDLDALMTQLAAADREHRYTVAWIDVLTTGRHLGRGVVTAGDHAEPQDLPDRRRGSALHYDPTTRLSIPALVPGGLLNRVTVAGFNEAWYRAGALRSGQQVASLTSFFHPLDAVAHWNRMYGPHGFVQYQFCVPDERADVVRTVVERLSGQRIPSFLAVLKRFGAQGSGHLSFPSAGWTLALDLPANAPGLARLLDAFDELVADAGGRVYLAKDARLRPDLLATMYPRLDEWRTVRSQLDPEGLLASDLSRRLAL